MKIHPIDQQLADVQRDDQGYLLEILHALGQAFRAETDSPGWFGWLKCLLRWVSKTVLRS